MPRLRAPFRVRAALALALMLAMVSSCSTPDRLAGPEASAAEPSSLLGALTGTLLACPAQPEVSAQQAIGPEGGTLQVGPHTLVVPPAALSSTMVISATAPSDPVVSVRFEPEGLTFARPARLTLSYAHCPLLARLAPKRIAYTTDLLKILEFLVSVDDLLRQQVSAPLDHFSRYAVAW